MEIRTQAVVWGNDVRPDWWWEEAEKWGICGRALWWDSWEELIVMARLRMMEKEAREKAPRF